MRPIAEALAARGIHPRGPVLPGHDAGPAELARVPFTAWIEAAREDAKMDLSAAQARKADIEKDIAVAVQGVITTASTELSAEA